MNDLTIIYYTANIISYYFAENTQRKLLQAINDLPIIFISLENKTENVANNLLLRNANIKEFISVSNLSRHHLSIYKQALMGAKKASTKYIALVEDDVLYPAEHFKHRSTDGIFAYNKSVWSMYTWVKPPLFSYKDRRNMYSLICERELFIEAMEERFMKYPTEQDLFLGNWSEPGKYEKNLGVTERRTEVFYTNIPLVAFSHETALSYQNLGKRKKLGDLRVTALPYWGHADEVISLYA